MKILLISIDEVGFQPLGLACAKPYLTPFADVELVDASTSIEFDHHSYDLIGFSVPTFGAIEKSVEIMKKFRQEGYTNPLISYNQYATVQPSSFTIDNNCFVVMGEYETVLEEIVKAHLESKSFHTIDFVYSQENTTPSKNLKRSKFLTPDRNSLPNLANYAYKNGKLVGNIETMRGCAHGCTYCSVFAAYQKRVIKIPENIVLEDIDNVVNMGATHITFIDADFFSTGKRGIRLIEKMHAKYPHLTFDITLRLDDVVRYREFFPDLKSYGCIEVTSAFEFPSDTVLKEFEKRITLQDMDEGLAILRKTKIPIVPTFISYNPWANSEDMIEFGKYLNATELMDDIDEMQLKTRLLLYKGSPLLENKTVQELDLIDKGYHYEWKHTDTEVDQMYESEVKDADISMRCCIKG